MTAALGINPTAIVAATGTPEYRLGTVMGYDHPTYGYQEFIYGRADGAIGVGCVGVEATGGDFKAATVTVTTPGTQGPGSRVGVAQTALADNEYGWFQIYGKGKLQTLLSAAKGTRLNTTATAGQLDDDGTAGSETILGITLLTATDGSATLNTDAAMAYPVVGPTI